MRSEDIPAGLRLCRAASWNQVAADWELFLTASPDGCRVATSENGDVVGTAATIGYGDAFRWIAMVLVDPSYRRAGIGTQLLKESLALVGDTTARLDATPAGRGVYVPLGFREEYGLQRMMRSGRGLTPVLARGSDPPDPSRAADDQRRFCRRVEGGSCRVRRRPTNIARNAALSGAGYAWVIGGGHIDGYLFGRHGYSFEHLGPVVARDESHARLLVEACTVAHADRSFIIDVPLQPSWIGWLESAGFALQRPFTRMCRGARAFHERRDRMFAIAGPEFG